MKVVSYVLDSSFFLFFPPFKLICLGFFFFKAHMIGILIDKIKNLKSNLKSGINSRLFFFICNFVSYSFDFVF